MTREELLRAYFELYQHLKNTEAVKSTEHIAYVLGTYNDPLVESYKEARDPNAERSFDS